MTKKATEELTAKERSRRERADRQAASTSVVEAINAATDMQGIKDAVAHLGQFDRNALDGALKRKIDRIVDAHIGAS